MATTFVPAVSWSTAGTTSGTGWYKDITFTGVAIGDRLTVAGASEGTSTGSRAVTTQSGTTSAWTLISPDSTTGADTDVIGAYATATSAGTIVVRVQVDAVTSDRMGVCGWRTPAGEWNTGGTPVTVLTPAGTDDPDGLYSITLPGGSTYTVFAFGADWNAIAVTTATGSQPAGGVNDVTVNVSGAYSIFARRWTGQTAGTRNYGPAVTTSNAALSGMDHTGFVFAFPEVASNVPPVASAGPDQSVDAGDVVTLTSAASTDSDGSITSRVWSQTAGTTVTLSSTSATSPTFTAPNVNETLTFSVLVTDNGGATHADSVNITVTYVPPEPEDDFIEEVYRAGAWHPITDEMYD